MERIAMGFRVMGFLVRWRCYQEDGENCNLLCGNGSYGEMEMLTGGWRELQWALWVWALW